jgi:hypothetical protein
VRRSRKVEQESLARELRGGWETTHVPLGRAPPAAMIFLACTGFMFIVLVLSSFTYHRLLLEEAACL